MDFQFINGIERGESRIFYIIPVITTPEIIKRTIVQP